MTDNIKLPPYPEGLCLREDIEDYAREAVRLNAQADTAPAGSGGWESHAKELERELAYWKQRAKTILEHQDGECWYWQGDGTDHPESMVDSLPVVIRADELRALMAPAAPQPARTALEQYDLEQSEDYRKGYDDGRVRGYGVGYRQATEHAAMRAQPLTDEQIANALGFGEYTVESTKATLTAVARAIEKAHGIGVKND